jgi:hypothetical protein
MRKISARRRWIEAAELLFTAANEYSFAATKARTFYGAAAGDAGVGESS